MKKIIAGFVAGLFLLGLGSIASATTIDFESVALGNYTTLDLGDLTITDFDNSFEVVNASPGDPISGHALINYYTTPGDWIVTFNILGVTSFSIGVGDYNQDVDNTYLEAYDASNNLLASNYYQNPASTYGGGYLSVTTSTSIAYVKFRDAEPFPGAVYWDNLSYNSSSVPEPATMLLFGTCLAGLAGMRIRSKRK